MAKLIATEMAEKPYIFWQTWEGENGPLVIDEADMPAFQFGVCPMKIVDGQLTNRTPSEMTVFEAEYIVLQSQRDYTGKVDALDTEHFTWSGFNFPMYEIARLLYSCIQYAPASNYKVLDVTGVQRTVLGSDTTAFLTSYYTKLTALTQP